MHSIHKPEGCEVRPARNIQRPQSLNWGSREPEKAAPAATGSDGGETRVTSQRGGPYGAFYSVGAPRRRRAHLKGYRPQSIGCGRRPAV